MLWARNIILLIILAVISYTDFKRQEIDHEPIMMGLAFIVPFSMVGYNTVPTIDSVLGFLLGGIVFTILAFWGMGGGDIKLIAMLGFFFGWREIIIVMYLSFVIGAIMGLIYVLLKKFKFEDFMPFGPAIALASIINLFFGPSLLEFFPLLKG